MDGTALRERVLCKLQQLIIGVTLKNTDGQSQTSLYLNSQN